LPRNVICYWVSRGDIVELPVPLSERRPYCGLVTRRDEPLGPSALELVELMRAYWRPSAPRSSETP
jgi:hypothetical protein